MMKKYFALMMLCGMVAACTTTQKSTGIGTVAGATIGGIIGHQSGKGGEGAAIGAAVGGVGGYIAGEKIGQKKFCPVGGEVFDESVQYCPTHGVELKYQTK
ncbi:MAG: glycine zipper 2TM domain-containing protein [Candidatus Omnitrophica bacterium]|nr:glycine zipper 2TM domain-containing protein [Candidatus Omnitrophota bacterium]